MNGDRSCTKSKTQRRAPVYVYNSFKRRKTTLLMNPELCIWIKFLTAARESHSKLRPSRPLEPRLH